MSEPVHAPLRSTEALALIESSPLDPSSWERLAEQARGQNDPLSIQSLDIIIRGLHRIEEASEKAAREKTLPVRPSGLGQAMFVRLAKAYNSPTLLKEAGLIYLRDLHMPDVALEHFDRSAALGAPEKELKPLMDAARGALQRLTAPRDRAAQSGVSTDPHANSDAARIIRRTGKMLLPARFGHAVTHRDADPESELNRPVPPTTAECLAEAETAVARGFLGRAEILLRQAEEKPATAPEMWQAWTNLGQAHYEKGHFVDTEAAFVEALKYDPNEMASHFNAALGYHLNQKFERAVAAYLRADELEPKHPKVWCNLGVLYFQTEAYEQAEAALRTAVTASDGYARAWDNLAAALGAQDKLEEAVAACQKAVALKPDYPEAYFKLGVIYFTNGRLQQAGDAFRRAAALPELSAYCDAFLAMVQARLDRPEAAEAAVRKAAATDPKCDLLWMAWNDLGLAWFARKQYDQALGSYGEATRLKPDEPDAWFNLGVSHHQLGALPAAREAYQQAVDLKEAMPMAWHNIGLICLEENELAAAMTAFRQETRWDAARPEGWRELGEVLRKLGRDDEAAEALAKAKEWEDKPARAALPRPAASNGARSQVALPPGLDLRLPRKDSAES
jgi:tetratricopeptide (TPR) repeat protein